MITIINKEVNLVSFSIHPGRDPCPAGGAAQVSGPAVRAEGAATPGSAGLLQEESGD